MRTLNVLKVVFVTVNLFFISCNNTRGTVKWLLVVFSAVSGVRLWWELNNLQCHSARIEALLLTVAKSTILITISFFFFITMWKIMSYKNLKIGHNGYKQLPLINNFFLWQRGCLYTGCTVFVFKWETSLARFFFKKSTHAKIHLKDRYLVIVSKLVNLCT